MVNDKDTTTTVKTKEETGSVTRVSGNSADQSTGTKIKRKGKKFNATWEQTVYDSKMQEDSQHHTPAEDHRQRSTRTWKKETTKRTNVRKNMEDIQDGQVIDMVEQKPETKTLLQPAQQPIIFPFGYHKDTVYYSPVYQQDETTGITRTFATKTTTSEKNGPFKTRTTSDTIRVRTSESEPLCAFE